MRILMLIAFFLFLGAFFIISHEGFYLYDKSDFNDFFRIYLGWFLYLKDGMKSITGSVIDIKWIPQLENYTSNNFSILGK